VSLSNAAVKRLLEDSFVCTWVNIAADPAAGSSHPHPCTDRARDMARGLGEHNMQTLILTPDGRLLSALAGYIGPADLHEELKFALSLWEKVRKTPALGRPKVVETAHAAFARQLAQRKGRTGLVGWEERFFGQLKAVGNKRAVADHQFSAKHPLLGADRFTTALMVGNAKSAFVSQTSGTPADLDALDLFPKPPPPKKGTK
jgi:hypothetical protein